MADINIGKAPPNSAILPFYATGAIAFWLLCLLLLLGADSFTAHYFNPHLLAIVHTAALGWGTMIIFGAAHQLLPVVCERDLFSPAMASLCWYTLTAGVALLVVSFWNFQPGWLMISGGVLVVLSAGAYFINAVFTSRICIHYSVARLFIVTSAAWLLFTVIVGLLLAIHLSHPFFNKNHLDILKLHAHAGLAGWFLQLITGISSKLVPMFLLGKSAKEKLLYYACILQNAGLLLFLGDGYFWGINGFHVLLYAVIAAAGIVCWLLYLYDTFRHRIRKKTDVQMKHTFVSFLLLVIAVLFIPLLLFAGNYQWTILYGTLLFMGWITGIILGKTFKTLPFIVWNGHYKTLSGKVKVPLPKHLYNEGWVSWQFRLFIAAILLLAAGIIAGEAVIIRIAGIAWLSVASLYLLNVMKTLLHKTKTL
ncbi:MAG: hypothetical protein KF862_08350 [Chitinophagaceae bacterium]|nr:hypothetical protein [Chitinophagaceae bacterium]